MRRGSRMQVVVALVLLAAGIAIGAAASARTGPRLDLPSGGGERLLAAIAIGNPIGLEPTVTTGSSRR